MALTAREREVLALLAGGETRVAVARRLEVSTRTVRRVLRSACGKLGVATVVEALALPVRSWEEMVQVWRAAGFQVALVRIPSGAGGQFGGTVKAPRGDAVLYTTQGLMTAADLADYRAQTDTGVTTVYLDDVPDWFNPAGDCPVCTLLVIDHEAVTVTDASGEIFACLLADQWESYPDERN